MANMGTADRVIRTIIAIVILAMYFVQMISGTLAVVLLVIAGIFLLTSFFSFCPIYALLGLRTNKKPEEPKKV